MTLNDLHQRVNNQIKQQKPFVLFSSFHDDFCSALFQFDKTEYTTFNFSESGFVLAPFDMNRETFIIPHSKSEFVNFIPDSTDESFFLFNESQTDPEKHIELVKKAVDFINTTELQKVVLARNAEFEFQEIDILVLFLRVCKSYPEAFTYCWFHPKTGVWLGASPETLLSITHNVVRTVALAGTKIYDDTLDVAWDDKNFEEQKFVSDYLQTSLSHELDQIQVSKPTTVRAGHLVHLQSVLTGLLKTSNNDLRNLIQNIHPTPAVCGLPKALAQEFIIQNETFDRSFYSGFLGQINLSNNNILSTNLVVNLRCMHIENTKVTLFAGGGITSKSIPENEWHETEAKIGTLKSIF